MDQPMRGDRMKPRITEDDIERPARGGIPLDRNAQVLEYLTPETHALSP